MKSINRILLMAGLAGGVCAVASARAAQDATTTPPATVPANAGSATPQPTTAAVSEPGAATVLVTNQPPVINDLAAIRAMGTNAAADFAAGKGLRLNFRQMPLQLVLTYMSTAAGFIIHTDRNVNIEGKVDVWSDQPMSKVEAVALLKQMLSENGYGVLENGRMLTIFPAADSKKRDVKVQVAKEPAEAPQDLLLWVAPQDLLLWVALPDLLLWVALPDLLLWVALPDLLLWVAPQDLLLWVALPDLLLWEILLFQQLAPLHLT